MSRISRINWLDLCYFLYRRYHVAVRKQDFDRIPDEVLQDPDFPPLDLHDFAHLVATNLCPELYANTYFADFLNLDPSLTALIRSAGINMARGARMSNGMIFGEILTPLWTEHVKAHAFGQVEYTYESLIATVVNELAEYVLEKRPLRHSSTGKLIKLDEPITPIQLAVLAQNKAYEEAASEIEQKVFTRGGPHGDPDDILDGMTAVQRTEFLAKSKSWLYFKVRNTIKHRAQKEAYRSVALHFLEHGWSEYIDLVTKILDNICYTDWEAERRLDLWGLCDRNVGTGRGKVDVIPSKAYAVVKRQEVTRLPRSSFTWAVAVVSGYNYFTEATVW